MARSVTISEAIFVRIQLTTYIWQRIALEECLEFMRFDMSRRGLVFSSGKRTDRIITTALARYTPSQVCRVIFSVNDHIFSDHRKLSGRYQPVMTTQAIDLLEDLVEKSLEEKLEILPMDRPANRPETMITRIFDLRVLKSGYNILNLVLSQEAVSTYSRCNPK